MGIYKTKSVCAGEIKYDLEGDTLKKVKFIGGCDGNTRGIESLVKGMSVDEVIERLSGIKCGNKNSSCPDQLAQALIQARKQG